MEETLSNLYLLSAVVGGTILVVQTILLMVGAGGDTDGADSHSHFDAGEPHAGHVDPDLDTSDSFFKILSFKTVVAFITFFGLTGLACTKGEMGAMPTLILAIGAGVIALYIVAYLMAAMSRLQSKGNLNLQNAVGLNAKVYLRVPQGRSGTGKVTVALQGRRVECKAVTDGREIPTGVEVRVVGTSASDTLEVLPVERS